MDDTPRLLIFVLLAGPVVGWAGLAIGHPWSRKHLKARPLPACSILIGGIVLLGLSVKGMWGFTHRRIKPSEPQIITTQVPVLVVTDVFGVRSVFSNRAGASQFPITGKVVTLLDVRKARERDDLDKTNTETIKTMEKTKADIVNADKAKVADEDAKSKADDRLRFCNDVTARLISYLEAWSPGGLVRTNAGSLKRNFRQLQWRSRFGVNAPPQWQPPLNDVCAKIQMQDNTNWIFAIAVDSTPVPVPVGFSVAQYPIERGDCLIIACQQNLLVRDRADYPLRVSDGALGLEICLKDELASFASIGWNDPRVNRTQVPITGWTQQCEILLQLFLAEIDRKHPLKTSDAK